MTNAVLETRVEIQPKKSKGVKRVILFALGGHIATQNASFRRLIEILEPKGYRFYGAKDGFSAFETGEVYELRAGNIPEDFAGFVAGAGRATLIREKGVDFGKLERARDFFRRGRFDIAIGSGGDDHGMQMDILNKHIPEVEVYVLNKTMDNDLGGVDGYDGGPFTDFTNGFHSAVSVGISFLHRHLAGAWTNNLAYIVCLFGRETNWVGNAVSYWGLADRFIYGELKKDSEGHSVEKIRDVIVESQDRNEKIYGRRFAMIVVSEGTLIQGVEHLSRELIDVHGHYKLNPEVLAIKLKEHLEKQYNLKTQTSGITYEMRNFPPTKQDLRFAQISADALARAIDDGRNGAESTFHIHGPSYMDITTDVDLIERVSQKRFCSYYELAKKRRFVNPDTFELTGEIGNYYRALFGERKDTKNYLPNKPKLIRI